MRSLRFVPFVAVAVLATGCANWSPAFDASGNWFMNVSGRGGNDVYAVGGTSEKGAVRHFDGKSWSTTPFVGRATALSGTAKEVFVLRADE